MKQQDFDNAFKSLPDAGSYNSDIYLIPIINESCILLFRKAAFIISGVGKFVRWELDKVEFT